MSSQLLFRSKLSGCRTNRGPCYLLKHCKLLCCWVPSIATLSVLEDFIVCTLDNEALGACKNEFIEYFFDNAMQIYQSLCTHAFFALPLASLLSDDLCRAFVAIHTVAFGAFLWLEHDELTYPADEVIDCIGQLGRYKLGDL